VTSKEAIAFVRKHGVVLMSARGPVPSLVQAIAGGPIRGSWWAHPKAHEMVRILDAVSGRNDVLACRLVDGKVTFIHRRLWPAVVRLSERLPRGRLAAIREEHTPQGRHRVIERPYPRWVPREIARRAGELTEERAAGELGQELVRHLTGHR
jgi:hypothetical protein